MTGCVRVRRKGCGGAGVVVSVGPRGDAHSAIAGCDEGGKGSGTVEMVTIQAQAKMADRPGVVRPAKGGSSRLGFALFVVLNTLLLIRPQELFVQLNALPLYFVVMVVCLVINWQKILAQLSWTKLRERPITLCVVGLAPVIVLSTLWQSRIDLLETVAWEYVKIVAYYLVLMCVVDTPSRLRQAAITMAALITVAGAMPLLDHFGVLELESLKESRDVTRDQETGKQVRFERLQGVGIFNDPNDLAQILAVGVVFAVYGMQLSRRWIGRLPWLAAMAVMLLAFYLTKSRGGLMALAAGLGVLFVQRFGWKKAVIMGLLVLPAVGMMLSGRQTDLESGEDSAQTRVQLWSDALQALREAPVMGLGAGVFVESAGQVAHNSFLQSFAETGFPGGFLFFTAYLAAIWGVLRLRGRSVRVTDGQLAKFSPVLLAALAAYTVGMLSLTRNYVIPTYAVLGLAAGYLSLVRTLPQQPGICWNKNLVGKSFAACCAFLLVMQLFVQASVRWK